MRRRLAYHDANRLEAVASSFDRAARLVAQAAEVRIVRLDIRGIADDRLEALPGKGLEPRPVAQLDVDTEAHGVPARDFERGSARVARDHARAREMALDG